MTTNQTIDGVPRELMTWDQIISKQTALVRQVAAKSPGELSAEIECLAAMLEVKSRGAKL